MDGKLRLVDIDETTEGTFFRCLHDEKPENPTVMAMRRDWHARHLAKGLRAKVLFDFEDRIVGLCQYLPIEHSGFLGKDLMAILCVWVHGYEHLVGNQQKQGYGRFILDSIEEDARASGMSGIAAWGCDFPYWNPVSFYEHMGYARADQIGVTTLVWKPFTPSAEPPSLRRPKRTVPKGDSGTKKVTVFHHAGCGSLCHICLDARTAVAGLDNVEYEEIDTSLPGVLDDWGISGGVYVDGEEYRPFAPPWTSADLRADLEK